MVNTSVSRKVKAYLGLGSNTGNREANLAQALRLLPDHVVVSEVSSIYESEPVGFKDQPWFLNAVCSASTDLSPRELLDYVKHIESQLGRALSFRNAPRPIDIDILFYGSETVDTKDLTIPHPRLAERAFVLMPLSELNPILFHPVKGQTVGQLLSALTDPEKIRKRKWSSLHSRDIVHQPSGTLIEIDEDSFDDDS